MRRLLTVLALMVAAPLSSKAADIFVSQSGGGAGTSCASPRAVSSLSGADWAPGNTIHLCGTITTNVIAQGSGAVGNVAILKFETGAKISMPVCPVGGCLQLDNRSYITVDGGVPCGPSVTNKALCNGIIEATANGSTLANKVELSNGISINASTNIEIKNLIIRNIYQHTQVTDTTLSSGPQPTCIYGNVSGSFINVHDSTMHDALWCNSIISGGVYSDVQFHNIETYNTGHAYAVGAVNQTDNRIFIYNNYDHDHSNWDSTGCAYHDDGVHAYRTGTGNITNLYVYNNIWSGNWSNGNGGNSCASAILFTEGINMSYWVFNNVGLLQNTPSLPGNGCWTITVGPSGSSHLYNNTCIMGTTSSLYDMKWEGAADVQNNATANGNLVVSQPSTTSVPPGSLIDYNFWGMNPSFCNWFSTAQSSTACNGAAGYMNFSQWKTFLAATYPGSGGDIHGNALTSPATLGLSATGQPLAGSPLIGAGHNLNGLCSGQPTPGIGALCSDINGVARPPVGNWDVGAYQFGSVVAPAAPTGLSGSVSGSTASFNWTASAGNPVPTAYTLYRGTVHGGPYSVVKSGITSLSTTDSPPNGTWFYTVTGYVGGIVSSITGNGTTATVTCTATCTFPNGTVLVIGGNTLFNGTFTSTGQPTGSTFTFSSSTSGTGTSGGVWVPAQESAKSNEVQLTVPAALTATLLPASRTFGSFTVGTSSPSQTFTWTNTSGPGGNVTISAEGFTGANPGDFSQTNTCGGVPVTKAPGTTCTFNVTFTPTAAGARNATLSISDNASGSPRLVSVSGTGVSATPLVNLNPTSLNFGDQTLSTTSTTRSIILTNTGTGTLTVTSVVASGDFAVVTVPATNCGGSVAPLATCSLNVTFTPTATGGRTGAVTVTDNATGNPHVATLSGNGITTKCQMTGNVTLSGPGSVCQ
jgi:hypothetical protein